MIIVSKSKGICGRCGAPVEIEWDPDIVSSHEKNMGIESEYQSEEETGCANCGNLIRARLSFWEHPEGQLEICNDIEVFATKDSDGEKTVLEKPTIDFFDL